MRISLTATRSPSATPSAASGASFDDPADGLVPGDDREHGRAGDDLDALELRDVAPAQPDRLDLQDRAARRRVGDGELADLVGGVAEEHRGAAGGSHVGSNQVASRRASRSWRLSTLPFGSRGSSSMNSIVAGNL